MVKRLFEWICLPRTLSLWQNVVLFCLVSMLSMSWLESSTSIDENGSILKSRNLIKITDLLGREIEFDKVLSKTTLFYLYDDGSVEKIIMLD